MNVDEMQAGPALDALVDEKVMGIQLLHIPSGVDWSDGPDERGWFCRLCGAKVKEWSGYEGCTVSKTKYSSDIAAAWPVVEKLRLHIDQISDNSWVVSTSHDWNEPDITYGYGDTAPLAICRAALKAV